MLKPSLGADNMIIRGGGNVVLSKIFFEFLLLMRFLLSFPVTREARAKICFSAAIS